MRLKSLEMQGFKSFPDKTVLTFGDGITAIVGPNGSGKSNISDAVRWVLGEQSTKTLRGSKMEDVIFGGTVKRNPVGYAEVSLTIDNSDGVLATEYNEVTITRRYYRSGDSEFYINRKMVRLRDIHELLMDTGLGRDGYSIIGQGRIDEILSLKSEDRREIFEEAAGISKFRHRKEEAERKLTATEENLCRIRDIIVELHDRVEPLAKQAADAKEYLRIFEELKGLEIDLWVYQLARNGESLSKLKSDLAVVDSQSKRGHDQVDKLYRIAEEIAQRIRDLDVEIEAARERRGEVERQRNEAASQISILENDKKNNLENIERIKADMGEEENRARNMDEQIGEREERVAALQALIDEVNGKIEEVSRRITELLSGEEAAATELTRIQGEREVAVTALYDAKIKLSTAIAENEAEEGKLTSLREEKENNKTLSEQVSQLLKRLKKEKREAEESLQGAENVLSGVALKKQKREQKVENLTEEYNKKAAALAALEHKLTVLRELERDMEGFSGAVKFIHRAEQRGELKGILGTVASIIRVEDEYTTAIETILGGALQNVVCNDEAAAKAGIALLKRENAGRVTFRPLTTIKGSPLDMSKYKKFDGFVGRADTLVSYDGKYKDIIEDLLGRIAVVENINQATTIAKDGGYKFRIVTLDGQVINAGGSYTGGSVGKKTGVLSRANEIERITKEIEDLAQVVKTLDTDKAEATRELNKLVYDSQVYENEKRCAEDALLKLRGEMERGEEDAANLEAEGERITVAIADLEAAIAKRKEKCAGLEGEIATLSEKEVSLKATLDRMLSDNEELNGRRQALNEEATTLRTDLAAYSAEREETIRARDQLVALKESLRGDNAQKEALVAEYNAKNLEIDGAIAHIAAGDAEFEAQRAAINGEIEAIAEKRLTLEADRAKADRDSKAKNEELLNLEREKVRLEARLEKAESVEADIASKLWENYELTISVAQGMAREIEAVTPCERRISQLKGERKKLGNVNLNAIEEYEEVSERYNFLTAQAEDLEKAKAELLEKIGDLTESMKDIFGEQFKIINENFSSTFTEIFGGGKAELTLEDPEDILNCGIDIKVQPPGKSLRTITLLSGGERAFVAIALYFAIMKVRPTPFCVLDEIEAALDDINVVRFANYLRKLTKTTQFIVITHRRGTMEEADVLYGVTMQDAGISKMLTISIAEVEHELKMKLK